MNEYAELSKVIDKVAANTSKSPILLCHKEHIATMREFFPSLKIIEIPKSCLPTENNIYILPDYSDEICKVKYVW